MEHSQVYVELVNAMKPFKVVTDPEAFQLLADETRRRIIYLLRAKEMNVSQIAEELELTPQAIYHHIRKMKDTGLVEVAREERVGHVIETYYRATAEVFYMSHGESVSAKLLEEQTTEALKNLPRLGFNVQVDPAIVSKLVELQRKLDAIGQKEKWVERLDGLNDVDFVTKQGIADLATTLSMSDKECSEWLKLYKQFRKVLRSILVQPVAVPAHKS